MRIFVASWFFPPNTSAEGIVTYKLLKYSKHEYDVCCSKSKYWSYENESYLTADNIHTYPVETNDINEWVDQCVEIFKQLNTEYHYRYIMTRSMPPESILVGEKIKKLVPSIEWIASFGDPIYRNPYELQAYINEDPYLKKLRLHNFFIRHPKLLVNTIGFLPIPKFRLLKNLYEMENWAMKHASMILVPSKKQLEYLRMIRKYRKYKNKCYVIPHSYDPELTQLVDKVANEKTILTYIGYLDERRLPSELIQAVSRLKKEDHFLSEKLKIQFIGNIDYRLQDMISAFFLDDVIEVEESVTYEESLRIMKQSDYLLHIDAHFKFLNGSIFFASKLADYIGSQNRIFALTDRDSEAAAIVNEIGGVVWEHGDVNKITCDIKSMISSEWKGQGNIDHYSAKNVAHYFDYILQENGRNQ